MTSKKSATTTADDVRRFDELLKRRREAHRREGAVLDALEALFPRACDLHDRQERLALLYTAATGESLPALQQLAKSAEECARDLAVQVGMHQHAHPGNVFSEVVRGFREGWLMKRLPEKAVRGKDGRTAFPWDRGYLVRRATAEEAQRRINPVFRSFSLTPEDFLDFDIWDAVQEAVASGMDGALTVTQLSTHKGVPVFYVGRPEYDFWARKALDRPSPLSSRVPVAEVLLSAAAQAESEGAPHPPVGMVLLPREEMKNYGAVAFFCHQEDSAEFELKAALLREAVYEASSGSAQRWADDPNTLGIISALRAESEAAAETEATSESESDDE